MYLAHRVVMKLITFSLSGTAGFSARAYFDSPHFSLVDAVFGPVFRYFDVFDRIGDFGVLAVKPKVLACRAALGIARQSKGVRRGVTACICDRLAQLVNLVNARISIRSFISLRRMADSASPPLRSSII
jgi:hypothetical protein